MTDRDYDPHEMCEEILDEVIKLYRYAEEAADWAEMPEDVRAITDEIFRLVAKACGITDERSPDTGSNHQPSRA